MQEGHLFIPDASPRASSSWNRTSPLEVILGDQAGIPRG